MFEPDGFLTDGVRLIDSLNAAIVPLCGCACSCMCTGETNQADNSGSAPTATNMSRTIVMD
jgi:hypothetical protein